MDEFILFLRGGLNNEEEQSSKDESERSEQSLESDNFNKRLDTAFPLSGGETDEDLRGGTDDNDDEDIEGTIFRQRLDTSFPLSGGETDEDLDHALE